MRHFITAKNSGRNDPIKRSLECLYFTHSLVFAITAPLRMLPLSTTKTNHHHRRQISDRTTAQHSGNHNSNSKNSLVIYSQEPHPIESLTTTFQPPAISSYIHQPQQLQENKGWTEPGPVFTPPHVIKKPRKLGTVYSHPTMALSTEDSVKSALMK